MDSRLRGCIKVGCRASAHSCAFMRSFMGLSWTMCDGSTPTTSRIHNPVGDHHLVPQARPNNCCAEAREAGLLMTLDGRRAVHRQNSDVRALASNEHDKGKRARSLSPPSGALLQCVQFIDPPRSTLIGNDPVVRVVRGRVLINQASCCNVPQLVVDPESAVNGFLFKCEATSTFSKSPPPDRKAIASKCSHATVRENHQFERNRIRRSRVWELREPPDRAAIMRHSRSDDPNLLVLFLGHDLSAVFRHDS